MSLQSENVNSNRSHQMKKSEKITKTIFVLSCILITTSIASYFFNQKIIQNKVYEVNELVCIIFKILLGKFYKLNNN